MGTRLAKLTLALAVVSTPAWAAVIDFEGVSGAGNPIVSPTLTVDGFDFTSGHFHVIGSPEICLFGGCVTPVQYIQEEAGSLGLPITMTKVGGGTFTFEGFSADQPFVDARAADAGGYPVASFFDVLVTFDAGGSTLFSFAADGGPSFQSFALALTDVISVQFSGRAGETAGGIAIDDIRVDSADSTPVPEPGTLLLLGAGLAGVAARRRKA